MKNIILDREASEYLVFVDIETLAAGPAINPDTLTPPGNLKKKETIEEWYAFSAPIQADKEYRKRSLDSMQGLIICIGVGIGDIEPTYFATEIADEEHEKEIVGKFSDYLFNSLRSEFASIKFIGHNFRAFDALWLKRKCWKYNFNWLCQSINTSKYSGNVDDTMEIWSCDNYQEKAKLTDIAKFLGLGEKLDGIDGSMVHDLFHAGEFQTIWDYCCQDVVLTRTVYNRLKFNEVF
jgi:3'-5' exonuclease